MSDRDEGSARVPLRREPPPLRTVHVTAREELSPRLLRLSLAGPGLTEMEVPDPAASVRLLVPSPGTSELVIPTWNGNEFLLPGGERPALRTFTPLRFDRSRGRLDLEIVRHPGGAVSTWAESVTVGSEAAISGPGRGYEIDTTATRFVLLGDETALPAISQLLEVLPPAADVTVDAEVITADAAIDLPTHAGLTVTWHVRADDARPGDTLVEAATALDAVDSSTRVWAAGEAASMQAIRTHLFGPVGMARRDATIRGYWKPAR